MTLTRLSALAGIAAVVLLVGMTVVFGALTPGYSHWSQVISELGARGAPLGRTMGYVGIAGFGMLILLFAPTMVLARRPGPITALSAALLVIMGGGVALAGLFQCDVGCSLEAPSVTMALHVWSSFVAFLAAAAAPLVLALRLRSTTEERRYLQYGLVTGLAMFGVTFWIMAIGPTATYLGALQRLFLVLFCSWVVVTAVKALRS